MIRIVKMTFKSDKIDDFLTIFNQNKQYIRDFDGIEHLSLLNDKKNPNIYFTYSIWKSEKYLEKYRKSELFNAVWSKTKLLFSEKPAAWSVEELINL